MIPGNPIKYLCHDLTWEKGRQLKSFDSNTYTYNANGIRTSKTVNGVKHTYTLDGVKILRETWGDNVLIPLYDNEDSVCGIVYNDTPYYFLKNLQGDIIAITNQNGQTIAKYRYDAWGKCTVTSDTSGSNISGINPFRYRGYYYDPEIGMYYLQSRYYCPVIGSFINADSCHYLGHTETSTSYNLFTYCCNSPVTNLDPFGFFALAIAGITISASTLAQYLMYLACILLLAYYLEQLIRLLSKTISKLIVELFETVEYSLKKALKKKRKKSTHNHHIIAKTASRAAPARKIWTSKMKLSINDGKNLVRLNSVFHSFMHQTAYYTTVNKLVEYGYNKKGSTGVLMVVAVIKGILSTINSWYF